MAVNGEYFDKLETMPAEVRREYQEKKLRQTIRHAYAHAPAVKEIFDKAGIKPSQIKSVQDLALVPVTRKTDLLDWQKKYPPYGGFVTIPLDEINRVFISPGPLYEPHMQESIQWFAHSMWAAGFRKGDVVVNSFTYHMSPAGMLFHEAIRRCGATAVPTGTGSTEQQIQTLLDLKCTGVVCTPTFLANIIKKAGEMGLNFTTDFSIRRAWFTGEMLAPSLRKTFENDYNIRTSQAYAVTELGGAVAYECPEHSGMHFMDEFIVEIIDPQTGRQLGPGEVGEITVTPLHNKCWGLVRFGTGALSSYTETPSACGRTSFKLNGIVGRTGDAVKVRGMFVVGKQAEQVVRSFESITQFQFVVTRQNQRDILTLKAELKDAAVNSAALAEELGKKFQDVCRVKLDRTEFITAGSIPAQHQLILDERKWD